MSDVVGGYTLDQIPHLSPEEFMEGFPQPLKMYFKENPNMLESFRLHCMGDKEGSMLLLQESGVGLDSITDLIKAATGLTLTTVHVNGSEEKLNEIGVDKIKEIVKNKMDAVRGNDGRRGPESTLEKEQFAVFEEKGLNLHLGVEDFKKLLSALDNAHHYLTRMIEGAEEERGQTPFINRDKERAYQELLSEHRDHHVIVDKIDDQFESAYPALLQREKDHPLH